MAEGPLAKLRQWSSIVRHYGGLKNTLLAIYR